ncbi:hypothetical protein [Embleya hyalina]|uniref:Uncharacterized protein n=1 Tax=Embleya hyalina TaxID=516124 RepID=A0A401YNL2_9ACTN|nr:hypothetical protein [Embleya hyalina]GCD96099.1 hypothetical protein EHYA_03783 [Embleya hyalina]
MSRRTFTAGATVGVAGAFAAVMALSGTAQALPPETRAISMNCLDLVSGTFGLWGTSATLVTGDPAGAPYPQRMKVATSTSGAPFPPNTITTTVRTVQTGVGGGAVWDFTGTVNPPGAPQVFGPLSSVTRIPPGTSVRLQPTTGTPSATNWSLRMFATINGYSLDVACTGYQTSPSTDLTF